VLNIARIEKPLGAIVQFGGQTPLKIAKALERAGLKILGTSSESIDIAEDRGKCEALVRELRPMGLEQPEAAIAYNVEEAAERAVKLGFPVLVRPSYVLGGKGMRIVHSEAMLRQWIEEAIHVSDKHPVLIDRFLDQAIEVDVDAISDSACSLPVASLSPEISQRIRTYTRELAKRLRVIGLMNAQFAVQGDKVYLLEVNPRASRTVPFVSKAIGKPLAKLAVQVMLGKSLHDLGIRGDLDLNLDTFNVKAPVFPFHKFPGVDVLLGPEMKSTGEVMGRGRSFAAAYAKALAAASMPLPTSGNAFLSIHDGGKFEILPIARGLHELGFTLWATGGTAEFLRNSDIPVNKINKVREGSPHCVEAIQNGQFSLIINTTADEAAIRDSFSIRRAALERKVPYSTVISASRAMLGAIRELKRGPLEILPLS
jgi:carbamoyl-phosphate synthase large subunit